MRASSAASAERAYLAAPEDHERLTNYVIALRHAGRLNDAVALRSKLPVTLDAMAAADEQMGWAVNSVAYALNEMGKTSDADRLLALLNEASIPDGGWRVSMIINRADMLATTGNFEKAATLLEVTEASAKDHGSPFAKQLVRQLRYCVLSSLGKKEEAAKVLPEMLKHADDQLEATIDSLICAGDLDKAEELALAGLKNPDADKRTDFEKDFVRALQPVPLTSDDPSVWQGRWTELRKRPTIAKEFARLGRDMPEEFLPPKPGTVASK